MKYYLIHGLNESRRIRMINEFKKGGINEDDVTWILYPNKNDITLNFRSNVIIHTPSQSCGINIEPGCPNLTNGQIACTFKHYLALKDIVENNIEYAIIMEDNMQFISNVPDKINIYISQLNELYPDWDILFDLNWKKYLEKETTEGIYVYPKSNEIGSNSCHGGTKCAQFYLVNYKCAKKLFDNYIPFNNAPDWWMNDLFRKLDIKAFWVEPANIDIWEHVSSA